MVAQTQTEPRCSCRKHELPRDSPPFAIQGENKLHLMKGCGRFLSFDMFDSDIPGYIRFEVVWANGTGTKGAFLFKPKEEPNGTSQVPV